MRRGTETALVFGLITLSPFIFIGLIYLAALAGLVFTPW